MNLEKLCKHQAFMVSKNDKLSKVVYLMDRLNVGCVVVVEDEYKNPKPIGIITDRDIALKTIKEAIANPANTFASDIMSKYPFCLTHQASIIETLKEMQDRCIRRIPVVDEQGKICGIVTLDDIFAFLIQNLNLLSDTIKAQARIK